MSDGNVRNNIVMKSPQSEMKNVFNGLIRRLNMAKGRLNNRKTGQKKLLKLQH